MEVLFSVITEHGLRNSGREAEATMATSPKETESQLEPIKSTAVIRSGMHQPGAYRMVIQVDLIADTGFNAPRVLDSTVEQTQQVVKGLIPGAKVAAQGELTTIKEGK